MHNIKLWSPNNKNTNLHKFINQLDKGLTIDCKKTLVDQRDKLQNEIDSFDKWAEAQSDIDTSIQLEVDKALGK